VVDASFAENFYGLKRRRRPYIETERARAAVGGVPVEEELRDREVWRSLIILVRSINIDNAEEDGLTRSRSASPTSVPRPKIITRTLAGEPTSTMVSARCRH
jgi:hypothetical protein